MRSKTQTTFIAASLLWIASVFIWPGCITAPLPSSRTPVEFRKKADFTFNKTQMPTRDELASRLGPPDAYFDDIKVACYRVDTIRSHDVFLLFFVLPIYFESYYNGCDVAFIQFGEDSRVKRAETVAVDSFGGSYGFLRPQSNPDRRQLYQSAYEWATGAKLTYPFYPPSTNSVIPQLQP